MKRLHGSISSIVLGSISSTRLKMDKLFIDQDNIFILRIDNFVKHYSENDFIGDILKRKELIKDFCRFYLTLEFKVLLLYYK